MTAPVPGSPTLAGQGEELAGLSEAATPGPWWVHDEVRGDIVLFAGQMWHVDAKYVGNVESDRREGTRSPAFDLDLADARYIAALVNAHRAGALYSLDDLETLLGEAEVVEAVAKSLASMAPGEKWSSTAFGPFGGDDEYRDGMCDQARDALAALVSYLRIPA